MPPQEGWVERQIREATERGEFDDLPGAGRPLPGLDNRDPDWWVKGMMAREGLDASDAMPPVLQLRKEAAGYPESLAEERSEENVRELLRDYNLRVLDERRRPSMGLVSRPVAPTVDVEEMVAAWRALRAAREPAPPARVEESPSPRPWWRRLLGR
ncbi:MAG TPA: DUF1992 domain-containing protein [Candidatus Janibacter merdipullorum]|nr:DUF1992 domain-containing protein [Candidatus Janibacter merdipullorum]